MFEATFTAADFDPYQLREGMNSLIARYDHTARQVKSFSVVMDELIYPVLNSAPDLSATLRLICSETGTEHLLMVDFAGLKQSPLTCLDVLNRALLTASCNSLLDTQSENGWEVILQL